MAVERVGMAPYQAGVVTRFYYICDTEAERPVSGLSTGDLAFTKDTQKFWVAINSTTWKSVP